MTKGKSPNNQNGKGDSPRSNSSKQFKDNYSKIKWKSVKKKLDKIKNK
jgi:hypothetical protein